MNEFNTMLENLVNQYIQPVESKDIPNIDLYMDQVTTFMDAALGENKRTAQDKILTKTMINNYAKAKIFPPPVKKKYTKNHIMLLIMLYHLKSILSIRDISILLRPITEAITKDPNSQALEKIYDCFVKLQKENAKNILSLFCQGKAYEKKDISYFEKSEEFEHFSNNEKCILMILFLTIQANSEKRLAERILDTYLS